MNRAAPTLTSLSNEWRTPQLVVDLVRQVGLIAIDPCSGPGSVVYATVEWDEERDGLKERWAPYACVRDSLVYVNPPYGRALPRWIGRCADEAQDCTVLALVPARTDTRWWHEFVVAQAQAVCFWRGRLKFGLPPGYEGPQNGATFPSALVLWSPLRRMADRFAAVLAPHGAIWRLP